MRTDELDYHLPEERIAQKPAAPRDSSRLLVVDRATGCFSHHRFCDLPKFLGPGDLLVMNDTRVIPARVSGRRHPTGGRVELLFHSYQDGGRIEALTRPARRLKRGQKILLDHGVVHAVVVADGTEGIKTLQLFDQRRPLRSEKELLAFFKKYGRTALPPYLSAPSTKALCARYQTVYAQKDGATAAPTAGLHFTPALLRKLASNRIQTASVTLHTGIGTFRPVVSPTLDGHKMHTERFEISDSCATAVHRAKKEGCRVMAVGTTTVRALEHAGRSGRVTAGSGAADLFIRPGHDFQIVDAMITNFHLPRTTLLALVMAFAGKELIRRAYEEAIREKYRFFSFGDAMLIV